MTTVTRHIAASPDRVFEFVREPRSYPRWLVGAKRIRHVDRDWPAPGSQFDHEVGVAGPLTVEDSTVATDTGPDRHLDLLVQARPLGRAEVHIEVAAAPGGCLVEMSEHVIGRLRLLAWLVGPLIAVRNERSLANLARLVEAEGRAAEDR